MPRYFQPHVVRAVAAALSEHVPAKGVVDIIESYRVGPELWYTGAPIEAALESFLLTVKWSAHHIAGSAEPLVDHIIASLVMRNARIDAVALDATTGFSLQRFHGAMVSGPSR